MISTSTSQSLETPTVATSPGSQMLVLQDGEVPKEQEEAAFQKHITAGECSNTAHSNWSDAANYKSRGSYCYWCVEIDG